MPMRVNTNTGADFAARTIGENRADLSKQLQKIATGLRINQASDDAAGLALAERMQTLTRGFDQAQDNIQNGASVVQIAEGGINEISGGLQRIRELAVQASNGTLTDDDRAMIQEEVDQIVAEIDRQVGSTTFNGQQLLNGDFSGSNGMTLQVGPGEGDSVQVSIPKTDSATLGVSGVDVSTQAGAQAALSTVSSAIDSLGSSLATLGATQNRLERAFNYTGIARENTLAAESRVRDLDFAEGIVKTTSAQIREQTGIAALAQANLAPQRVLQLLQ